MTGPGERVHGKVRYDLVPVDALEEIAAVLTHGAIKHGAHDYRENGGRRWGAEFAACLRHLWEFWRGNDRDAETGRHALAHAGARILILLQLALEASGRDDRFKRNGG